MFCIIATICPPWCQYNLVLGHQSPVMCYMSPVMCHMSLVTCHLTSTLLIFTCYERPRWFDDVAPEGLVINRVNKNIFFLIMRIFY